MPSLADLDALKNWLIANGGRISSDITVRYSVRAGVHCQASRDIPAETILLSVPHGVALSSLNALVDEEFAAFRGRGLAVEAIGHFYLMRQHLAGKHSFWRPYLQTLPDPAAGHTTPFWFDEQDSAWLADTDVYHTAVARRAIHERNYHQGIELLKKAQVDTAQYTWNLYLWAVTMFTSRSFSSRTLRPDDGKYWAAYRAGPEGRRQAVLLDMSHESAENLDFPVLFPVVDIPNHASDAKMVWSFEGGRFSIAPVEPIDANSEVLNNYGPKGNDELLLGYGFCLQTNPWNKVLLTLKPPPDDLQKDLLRFHPGYFDIHGAWNSEKATFGLTHLGPATDETSFFEGFPEPLLELLVYILRHERGLPFRFIDRPLDYLSNGHSTGRRYKPHLARAIVQSLAPKLARMQSSTPNAAPTNYKQEQAKIYRDGQLEILTSVITGCRCLLRDKFRPASGIASDSAAGVLLTLEELLQIIEDAGGKSTITKFLAGIESNAGTDDIEHLRQAGWEEDVLVLLLCFLKLDGWNEVNSPEYLHDAQSNDDFSKALPEDDLERAQGLMELVKVAAQSQPSTVWEHSGWTAAFIAQYGGMAVKYDSFVMMLPVSAEQDSAVDARLVLLISSLLR